MKHITRAAFREREERAAASPGTGRLFLVALIGVVIGATILAFAAWQIGNVLVKENVVDRWISWWGCWRITIWAFLIRTVWLALHKKDE